MYLTCPESNIEPQPTVNVGQAADPTYPLAGPPWDKRDPPDGSWRTPKGHSELTVAAYKSCDHGRDERRRAPTGYSWEYLAGISIICSVEVVSIN